MKKLFAACLLACLAVGANAQDKKNSTSKEAPTFTTVKANPITSIKDQNRSGTCWAYSTLSFLESEILKNTGKTYDLCEMFIANKDYMDRAVLTVRMHGDSQFAVWSSVHVAGMSLNSYCAKSGITIDRDEIEKQVITSGSQVIQLKGATFYGIASITAQLCNTILKDKRSIYNVSTLLDDYYGISGVCVSVPTVLGLEGAIKRIPFDFTGEEMDKLVSSARKLREFLDTLNI